MVGFLGKETKKLLTSKIELAKEKMEFEKELIFSQCEEGKFDKNLEEISPKTLTILLENYVPHIQHLLIELTLQNLDLLPFEFGRNLVKKYEKMESKIWTKKEDIQQVLLQLETKKLRNRILYNQLRLLTSNRLEVITSLEKGEANTYCLTMPGTHRFVQNGFIMNNCQGSGIKTVIMGIDYSAFKMLTKELVYTGITRAKQKCILVAENKALRKATKSSNLKTKQTFLKHFLNNEKL